MLVSGARNFATGVKNRHQKPTPVFWCWFLAPISGACVTGIRLGLEIGLGLEGLGFGLVDLWISGSSE